MDENYFVYITTNPGRTILYVGMTNHLVRRLEEHLNQVGNPKTFTGRYFCYNLIYWERFPTAQDAIDWEKEIKGWRREKKIALIQEQNPQWIFLNHEI